MLTRSISNFISSSSYHHCPCRSSCAQNAPKACARRGGQRHGAASCNSPGSMHGDISAARCYNRAVPRRSGDGTAAASDSGCRTTVKAAVCTRSPGSVMVALHLAQWRCHGCTGMSSYRSTRRCCVGAASGLCRCAASLPGRPAERAAGHQRHAGARAVLAVSSCRQAATALSALHTVGTLYVNVHHKRMLLCRVPGRDSQDAYEGGASSAPSGPLVLCRLTGMESIAKV